MTVKEKMLSVLSDGLPHTREELHACLSDELGPLSTIRVHICALRKILRPRGEDILCVSRERSYYYQQVRLLASATNGYR